MTKALTYYMKAALYDSSFDEHKVAVASASFRLAAYCHGPMDSSDSDTSDSDDDADEGERDRKDLRRRRRQLSRSPNGGQPLTWLYWMKRAHAHAHTHAHSALECQRHRCRCSSPVITYVPPLDDRTAMTASWDPVSSPPPSPTNSESLSLSSTPPKAKTTWSSNKMHRLPFHPLISRPFQHFDDMISSSTNGDIIADDITHYPMSLASFLTIRRQTARLLDQHQPLLDGEILYVSAQVCQALIHCQKHLIVHRGNPFPMIIITYFYIWCRVPIIQIAGLIIFDWDHVLLVK
jgi:hypothetical protein